MSPEEFKIKMNEILNRSQYDQEINHIDADDLLCEALSFLGYNEGIELYLKISKWYA